MLNYHDLERQVMEYVEAGLSLGGNLGAVLKTLREAACAIEALSGVRSVRFSPLYRTAPISPIPQPDYLNTACMLETSLSPRELLERLQQIEVRLGKRPKARDAPRPIDIDILFYGSIAVDEPDLQLPHPRWQDRLFVVAPLSDLLKTAPLPKGGEVDLEQLRAALAQAPDQVVHCVANESIEDCQI